jgi:endonuclease/exonuclease/phosphatase family metal-dependent hydrolase
MKKFLKIVMIIILILILGFAGLILTAVISDYDPDETTIVFESKESIKLTDTLEFEVLNWNIGYGGLDKSMDFFYDGGQQVRTSKENTIKNLNKILEFIKKQDSIEFFLFQEVDKKSKRSYKINEFDTIKNYFKDYFSFFGTNYDVFFVPTPITKPYGKVLSGLMSVCKFQPDEVVRYSFPGKYAFPKGLFMLDRCFLVNRFPLENGKELLLINTHNEAFDPGDQRKAQMEYLKNFILAEYKKGNFVVVGGDWNQCPPGLKPAIEGYIFDDKDYMPIKPEFLPAEWKFVFKNNIPTNRRLLKSWDKSNTAVTIIDFFLISPNIENISIQNMDLNFENADHNPVIAKFRLLK